MPGQIAVVSASLAGPCRPGDWLLEQLLTFDADAAVHQDNGDGEPEDDAQVDGPPSGH